MAAIDTLKLLEALPEDARPAAMEEVTRQNPGWWYAWRKPGDPELQSFYPKNAPALATDRAAGRGAPYYEEVTTPARDGKRATTRVFYRLIDVHRWLLGEIEGGKQGELPT